MGKRGAALRCSECGFKSDFKDFFRRERGGWLDGAHTVCEACVPYRLTKEECNQAASQIYWWLLVLMVTVFYAIHHLDKAAFPVFLGLSVILTSPIRTFIHEFGHAAAARIVGQKIVRVRIGRGPAWFRVWLFGISFDILRYSWMGGETRHGILEAPHLEWKTAATAASGPVANIVTGGLALCGAILLGYDGAAAGILTGFAVMSFATAMLNLMPEDNGKDIPSDGFRLLNAFRQQPVFEADLVGYLRVSDLTAQGKWDDAVTAAASWQSSAYKGPLFALVVHCISRRDGDAAALDYYTQVESALPDRANYDPLMEINLAWCAIKVGDTAFCDLAERMVQSAWTKSGGQGAEYEGTYGAWLVSVGRAADGIPLLAKAARRIWDRLDKSDFCRFLAEGWRQQGDMARAEAYVALQKRYREKATS